MVLVAGMDPGVQNIGLVIFNTEGLKVEFAECISGCNYPDFLRYFSLFIKNYKPDYVGIEKPFFTSKSLGKNIRTLELIGIMKLVFQQGSIPYESFSPSTIKKAVTGNGHADKQDVITKIHELLNFPSKVTNNHITDAAGVAYTAYLKANET